MVTFLIAIVLYCCCDTVPCWKRRQDTIGSTDWEHRTPDKAHTVLSGFELGQFGPILTTDGTRELLMAGKNSTFWRARDIILVAC